MSKPWLTIIGMGASGPDSLAPHPRKLVEAADIIITAKRSADDLAGYSKAEIHTWPVPFDPMFEQLQGWRGKNIVVIATGDPLWHGVGSIIARKLQPDEYEVYPSPSAFSLISARLGWPLSSVQTLTLHGYSRPSELIIPFIQPNVRLMALTSGSDTVHEVAAHLNRLGYEDSTVHVLENMTMANENLVSFAARDIGTQVFSDFNSLGIECRQGPNARHLPRTPGLPDDVFENDGQITKRDVRAVTLAALGPTPGQLLWDVGAGCGSIAIEWMRTHLSCQATAFESNGARCAMIEKNAKALGTPYLKIIEGKAPQVLADLPQPDAVFIGGGITADGVFESAWRALKAEGRMVCNVVTLQGRHKLQNLQAHYGGELVEIATSRLQSLGRKQVMKPAFPVLQWRVTKP